jgi:hypothetical protein
MNYMGAEMASQQAQQQNEANFYRERLMAAVQQNQANQEEIAQQQETLGQLEMQAATAGTSIQTATQQAVQAQERALEHSQQAAKMRMGMQQMREQMLTIASQDPTAIAEQKAQEASAAAGQQVAAQEQQAVNQQAGQPGAAPEATSPGTVPAENNQGGGTTQPASGESGNVPDATAEAQTQAKTGSVASAGKAVGKYMKDNAGAIGGGAVLGAGLSQVPGLLRSRHEANVSQMEQSQPSTFGQAMRLAGAKQDVAKSQATQDFPAGAAMRGAAAGAVLGPAAYQSAKLIKNVIS